MSTDRDGRNDPESKFTFGVMELLPADEPKASRLAIVPDASVSESRGFDPYNSAVPSRKLRLTRTPKR